MTLLLSRRAARRWLTSIGMALTILFGPAPAQAQEQRQVLVLYGGSLRLAPADGFALHANLPLAAMVTV